MYDIAITGAGPAGSRLAYRLAEEGHSVVVIERKERLDEPVCCTGIIGQECVRSFSIDESVIYRQANSARLFSPSGNLIRVWRQESQASIVDRAALNLSLANRARDKGAEYCLNSTVMHAEVSSDRVRIEIGRDERDRDIVEARALVIASGFGSRIVGKLGLGSPADFVMGVQAEVEAMGLDEVEVYFGEKVAPGFFAWLVPTLPGRALAGLLSRRNPGDYLRSFLSTLSAQGKINAAGVEFSYSGVLLKPPSRTYGNRVIVVGSAAGQVKPTTGGGVYYGLICADIAADNLHQALENDTLTAKSLADYERKWKKKLGGELKLGYRARKFYERLGDSKVDRIFDIIKENGIDKALAEAEDMSFDWHGGVVMKLIGHKALSQVMGAIRLPFSWKQSE
ncbi:NAD(P)/FAD-dependent oxidoreductase [Chloroflexota bacterium]